MKNSKIYPWVLVALLWVVALLKLYGQANAGNNETSHDGRFR